MLTLNSVSTKLAAAHAEVESVPLLLRRIVAACGGFDVSMARPFRVKRNRVVKPDELERAIRQTVRDRSDVAGIIVLIDSDDDCPAKLCPQLLDRARKVTKLPVAVVIAAREFESWFLGAKESLRGVNGVREDAIVPPNPENIRGAKEHLTQNMTPGRRYLAVDDQAAFAEKFDLNAAKQFCSSFEKCFREVQRLYLAISITTS